MSWRAHTCLLPPVHTAEQVTYLSNLPAGKSFGLVENSRHAKRPLWRSSLAWDDDRDYKIMECRKAIMFSHHTILLVLLRGLDLWSLCLVLCAFLLLSGLLTCVCVCWCANVDNCEICVGVGGGLLRCVAACWCDCVMCITACEIQVCLCDAYFFSFVSSSPSSLLPPAKLSVFLSFHHFWQNRSINYTVCLYWHHLSARSRHCHVVKFSDITWSSSSFVEHVSTWYNRYCPS